MTVEPVLPNQSPQFPHFASTWQPLYLTLLKIQIAEKMR